MNPQLPQEAADFGAAAEKAFVAHGAVDLARRAEADPAIRDGEAAPLLRSLGADDLDPRDDLDVAAAAGEFCRAAGRSALPYPVVATVLRDREGYPTVAVQGDRTPRVDHGDLFPAWRTVTFEGASGVAAGAGRRLGSRLGPFVCDLEPPVVLDRADVPDEPDAVSEAAWWVTLTGWRILGSTERALELAVSHVSDREQFGQKLSEFQAVQFQLADAAVAVAGLGELCRYTTWKAWSDPDDFPADALALRLYCLDSARSVLRTSQQLHGAAGVCDEYDVSVLARHIQPDLRLPFGATSTASRLVAAVDQRGFEALFPQGGIRQ